MKIMPRRHFWAVAAAFAVVMAFSSLPSPLYGLYQQRDGFSAFTVTLIFAAYSFGVVVALFTAGHLSDWHGRRRLLVPAIAAAGVSAALFLVWRTVPGLLVARFVNGLSVGVVTATATAYLAELGGRRAQLVGTAANLGGIGTGPLIGGALAQWAPAPLTLPYVVFVALLALALVAVLDAPETRAPADPRPAYRVQRVQVRGEFAAALAGAFVAFATMGLFTGLAGTFLTGTLHQTSHVLAGVAVAAVFFGGVAAQLATSRWATRQVLAAGMALMPAGLALIVLGAWLPSLALFLVGGAVAGAGAGAVFKGTVTTVIELAEPAARAEALAGLFLSGYLGMSVPVVGAGISLQYDSPRDTLLGFAVLVVAGIMFAAPKLLTTTGGRGGLRLARQAA